MKDKETTLKFLVDNDDVTVCKALYHHMILIVGLIMRKIRGPRKGYTENKSQELEVRNPQIMLNYFCHDHTVVPDC